MRALCLIALNTYREIIRDRILYGLILFSILIMGLSLLMGELSFAEQTRITLNFGLVAAQLSAVALSIFIGSSLVFKEIERRTVQSLLSRPVSRTTFLLGKFLGLALVQMVIVLGLAAVLAALLFFHGIILGPQFVAAFLGILLEGLVLMMVTMFFGVFTTPTMGVAFSVSVFLIGHWVESLKYFAEHGKAKGVYQGLSRVLDWGVPNLELLNWRAAVIYADPLPPQMVIHAVLYSFGWFLVLFVMAALILRRRDFV